MPKTDSSLLRRPARCPARLGWTTLALLILTGSLALLSLFLYLRGRDYYLQLNAVRLDPVGLGVYPASDGESQAVAAKGTDRLVVLFGDSRVARWPAPVIPGHQFINRGIEAQTSAQVLARFDAQVKPLRADFVLVQLGVNDLKTIPLWPERRAAIVRDCEQNLDRIVALARESGAVVILTTVFPTGDVPIQRRPFWSPDVGRAVEQVNSHIRSLAGPGVIVFDAYDTLAKAGTSGRLYQDELHLNPEGHSVLNAELERLLAALVVTGELP